MKKMLKLLKYYDITKKAHCNAVMRASQTDQQKR